MPSVRGASPRPSVIPRPKRAPRTEGVPPSIGNSPGPKASRPRLGTPRARCEGKMPSVRGAPPKRHPPAQALPRTEGVPPSIGNSACPVRRQDALGPGRLAPPKRHPPAQACSPDRGRPALDWEFRLLGARARCPRSGAPRPAQASSPGPSVLPGPRASRPRLGTPRARCEGRMPSVRGAPPRPSVIPRPKRAPRTEGVPPSIGNSACPVRGQDALGPGRPAPPKRHPPGPSVIPRPKRAPPAQALPRTEGVPPSIGLPECTFRQRVAELFHASQR